VIDVVERLCGDGTFRALLARIREMKPSSHPGTSFPGRRVPAPASGASGEGVVIADGLWGSFAPVLAGTVARQLQRPLLYITAHLDQADTARDDLELFSGQTPELLSAFETITGEGAASDEIAAERIRLCAQLARRRDQGTGFGVQGSGFRLPDPETGGRGPEGGSVPLVARPPMRTRADKPPVAQDFRTLYPEPSSPLFIVAPVQALMQAVPSQEALAASLLTLAVGQRHDLRQLGDWLVQHGYTRLDQVESPGDFALRGDILDIYPPAETDPYRIDFFDDAVEAIRRFDVSTQRSERTFESVQIAAVNVGKEARPRANRFRDREDADNIASFFSYLPRDTIVAFDEPVEIQELGRTFWTRLNQPRGMMPVENLFRRASSFAQLHLFSIPGGSNDEHFSFGVQSLARFETKTSEALREMADLAGQRDVLLYCDSEPEKQRFVELWQTTLGELPARLELTVGLIHRGFDWPGGELAIVGHHEIFHRYQQRRKIRKSHAARPIESWLDLHEGDHVVHIVHGIGRFLGMKTIRKDSGKTEEFLTLQFADDARIHVPVNQIDLVQKYIGAGGIAPQLTKVGGTRWSKTKERVEESVSDLAAELLRIQATRSSQAGIAYPDDTIWQREFEGGFIYTETEDQLTALDEIKRDMRRQTPMDRLLCGDVGYGKTELAIRGAFKAVEYGKQVAVLVPTTVLAEQHERTFRERMADFPFAIESLSRFKTAKQAKGILERVRRGQVDIVIGTHRLLSKDVGFKDLGLLVIDEEQRFGVEHKERLKGFRETIDVLTMSATPIPRTLHMSLMGIRDISSLATPPLDRRAIVTRVTRWDDRLIREAIIREMGRDGQVFFVHNFVHDIQSFADKIQQIVPEARIIIGHGQMREHELEKVMVKFIRHEADVLVCTTIIESGLDIPNCNTILMDRADRFGLSELHQLRGRVGRYKHRAYCYLLLSRDKPVTPTAAKRLKAIEEYSDLGAGFRIAMRDLEIRGAGNILGPEQSGHIAAVGYELYCQLLDQAVRRLKNEPVEDLRPVHLELDVQAHIPRGYIESDRQRMEIYRRLVRCRSLEELEQLSTDLKDAFGSYPPPVQTLLDLAEIRVLAQPWKIRTINPKPPDLIFTVDELALVEPLFARSPGSARMADAHTIHLRLTAPYFEPDTLVAVLRKLLQPAQAAPKIAAR
jgi:transcription-repair coupling factor (superfamily II helicase)